MKLVRLTSLAGVLVAVTLPLSSACAEQVAGASQTPSEALAALHACAKKNDVECYKKGLSTNFQLVIERYQELGQQTPELKGAFSYETFMRAMAIASPKAEEERIEGNKATVYAKDGAGQPKKTQMVLEDGVWKLEVPPEMVKGLDHFDEVKKRIEGENPAPRPEIKTGGGGKADRFAKLPKDAKPLEQQKAKGLDAFDLGDLAGAMQVLEKVQKESPDDEEVTVALGRIYVQSNKGKEAVKLLSDFLKKHPDSSPARHYIGMAYMFEKAYDLSAANWRKILKDDPEYAAKFRLEQRANVADAMHKQATGDPMKDGAPSPHGTPPPPGGGAASQPGGH